MYNFFWGGRGLEFNTDNELETVGEEVEGRAEVEM
jgi:hypothetical protein